VYGENVRYCVPFDSIEHGRVMAICVGAMMVGSTVITAKQGPVKRTDEFGYFQFGRLPLPLPPAFAAVLTLAQVEALSYCCLSPAR
jgi:phosphatidylserine decarboxylase